MVVEPASTTDRPGGLAIEARGVVKRFGKVEALSGLDLVARRGEVTAVLGPNGAGKTTFVRAVATLIRPQAGTLRVHGVDVVAQPGKVRQMIGLAGQFAAVEPTLTGRENIRMVARLYGQRARQAAATTAAMLAQLGLDEVADRPVKTYSGGLRRRLDLGASLVGAPSLLLLDEPTTGLDPRSRSQLWQAIRELAAQGTDVLLTTQYLDEADRLAHQVVIIDRGRVLAQGTPSQLKGLAGQDVVEVRARRPDDLPQIARALSAVGEPRVDAAADRVTMPVDAGQRGLATAVQALDAQRIDVDDIGLRRPTLDEVFLTLTGIQAGPGDGEEDDDA
ncbi:MAG: ATP-binding cassette domain-containing protein [Streptosporangiaceae bacterium]